MSRGILLVANWESDVGYSWWLMESYWCVIARKRPDGACVHLVYPELRAVPHDIAAEEIAIEEHDFTRRSPRALYRQFLYLRKNSITDVYLTDQKSWDIAYAIYRLAGVKRIITHDHTPGNRSIPGPAKSALKKILWRLPWVSVDATFSATEFVRQRHLSILLAPPDRAHLVPNGLPPKSFPARSDARAQLNLDPNTVIMVSAARADYIKGIDFALHCVAEFTRQTTDADFQYLFAGDGDDLDAFKELSEKLKVSQYVRFLGRLSDVTPLLAAGDFAMHPSRGEVGYSLSILEYMQAGLPVVVPNDLSVCGASTDGVDSIIYEAENVRSGSAAIERLYKDVGLRRHMGLRGKSKVAESYSLERTHIALVEALRKTRFLV